MAVTLALCSGQEGQPLPAHSLIHTEFQKSHVFPLTARAASCFKGFRSEHIRMVFIFHFSSTCPVLKLLHFKNIFIFLFRFPIFGPHSFLSKEGSSKAVLYVSDGGNLLSVIEIKDNGQYSAAVMHEHAVLKSRVRVRANYSWEIACANITISK